MAEGRQQSARHPMGVVVQRTGLSAHVLRAWERRYGAVEPGRTEGGQRLYSDADVLRLRLLKRATEAGRPIGTVARLSTESLAGLVGEDANGDGGGAEGGAAANGGGEASEGAEEYLASCLEAAESLDGSLLRAELIRAVLKLSAPVFVTSVVTPLLERVGERWEAGTLRPAQEHVVSAAVRQVLDWVLGRYEARRDAPLLVAGTPAGELHEFGAMLAAIVAADAGWRVLYLGPSLPASEIAGAAERAGAQLVALSVVDGRGFGGSGGHRVDLPGENGARVQAEVAELRSLVPEGVLVVLGGRRSEAASADGVTRVADLDAWREVLAAAGPSGRGGSS